MPVTCEHRTALGRGATRWARPHPALPGDLRGAHDLGRVAMIETGGDPSRVDFWERCRANIEEDGGIRGFATTGRARAGFGLAPKHSFCHCCVCDFWTCRTRKLTKRSRGTQKNSNLTTRSPGRFAGRESRADVHDDMGTGERSVFCQHPGRR